MLLLLQRFRRTTMTLFFNLFVFALRFILSGFIALILMQISLIFCEWNDRSSSPMLFLFGVLNFPGSMFFFFFENVVHDWILGWGAVTGHDFIIPYLFVLFMQIVWWDTVLFRYTGLRAFLSYFLSASFYRKIYLFAIFVVSLFFLFSLVSVPLYFCLFRV